MILACDSGSWRYDVFPQYKHSRKVKREADTSGINWDFVNEVKEDIISDLDTYFPFPVIKLDKAEGDCCIGVLTKHISENSVDTSDENLFGETDPENILIISSDGDNYQLHTYKNVKQWSPASKKLVKPDENPRNALIRKIVKGDLGDGIPSIKSNDNTFVDGIRQKPIAQTFLDKFFAAADPISICEDETQKTNYLRNELLVSYEKIPENIKSSIIECYNTKVQQKHSKMGLMNYFVENKMQNLLSQIHDFY